jgi:hypothetical protein
MNRIRRSSKLSERLGLCSEFLEQIYPRCSFGSTYSQVSNDPKRMNTVDNWHVLELSLNQFLQACFLGLGEMIVRWHHSKESF